MTRPERTITEVQYGVKYPTGTTIPTGSTQQEAEAYARKAIGYPIVDVVRREVTYTEWDFVTVVSTCACRIDVRCPKHSGERATRAEIKRVTGKGSR